ncbi:MAG: hypothetical protein ACOX2L_04625 [Anaerolineae bacterium]|jgi:hypothetical protein|nr:hypothetical protein [Chloroflexota bacterium]
MDLKGSHWPKVLGYLLWVLSALIGLGALFAAIDTVERVSAALIQPGCDPLRPVECSGAIRTVWLMAYAALGIIWVIWYIVLAERYPSSKTLEVLARRFALSTAIQVAIILLWVVIARWPFG